MATGQVIVEEMNPKSDDQYKVWKTLNHPTKLKAVASNHLFSSFYRFAVAGGNMVTICELPNDAANNPVLNEKPYIDDTVVESFLAVSWAEKDDTHYILAGGLMCIIRSSITLSSHNDSITDIQCSPFNNALVLSASQDRTVRLWSTKAGVCLIKCCQKSESSVPLLSVFFYLSDKYYVFCPGYQEANMWTNKNYKTQKGEQVGQPISLERITAVPSIDCVCCLETQALSQLRPWFKPIPHFPIKDSGTSKFGKTGVRRRFAVGNRKGAINVFDVNRHHSVELVAISPDQDSHNPIVHSTISSDGRVVFTVNEKGVATIWICNLNADVTATTTPTNDDGVAVPERRESTRTRRPNSRYMDYVL
ncbi:hypothetical protein DY000_02027088 [Brassica cretica]|uniref:Anaphase-promoting complex subunit 4 WD40 domain-containing protein n=1 Tax=Brassica cretica TaxID=69181 RepID=A0ABQ7EFT3_BRACR|nr:hypothetical protein DY000_02027088 [Brassica cretica]